MASGPKTSAWSASYPRRAERAARKTRSPAVVPSFAPNVAPHHHRGGWGRCFFRTSPVSAPRVSAARVIAHASAAGHCGIVHRIESRRGARVGSVIIDSPIPVVVPVNRGVRERRRRDACQCDCGDESEFRRGDHHLLLLMGGCALGGGYRRALRRENEAIFRKYKLFQRVNRRFSRQFMAIFCSEKSRPGAPTRMQAGFAWVVPIAFA